MEAKKGNISELEFKLLKVDLAKMAFEQMIMESIGFEEVFERIKVSSWHDSDLNAKGFIWIQYLRTNTKLI